MIDTDVMSYKLPDGMAETIGDREKGKDFSHYRKNIVTKVAYLIGVDISRLENEEHFACEELDGLKKHEAATLIRELCQLRTQFFKGFLRINDERNNFKRIDELDGLLNVEVIKDLRTRGYEVANVSERRSPAVNIAYINQFIQDNVDKLKDLFPDWIKFNYIRNLFLLSKGYSGKNGSEIKKNYAGVTNRIRSVSIDFSKNRNLYPFGMYISWPRALTNKDGYILINDLKFLEKLYSANNDSFSARKYVVDARMAEKEDIYRFVSEAKNIVAYVDCENVDPYVFAATLRNLDRDNLSKIKSIKLYDDVHTSTAWDYVSNVVDIPVEHIDVERVLENKSLVDMMMALSVSEEYYENDAESAILVSSDSDFWALIDKMSDKVSFYVLNEKGKTSAAIIETLDNHGVSHCYMSDFAQDVIQEFKSDVLFMGLESRIREFNATGTIFPLKVSEILDELFEEAYIRGEAGQIKQEKDTFYNKYLKNGLQIKPVEKNGELVLAIEIKRK